MTVRREQQETRREVETGDGAAVFDAQRVEVEETDEQGDDTNDQQDSAQR